ncbi:MAG TPA: type I-E CRISPR-associated protein Cse2/CasB [Actinocrinis sp.]|nr:type I-E CRISPR-associated protein Cse2/CasB [Actinocrinis sp.]
MITDPVPPRSQLIAALERKHARAASADVSDLALLRRALPRLPMHPDPRALAIVVGYCGSTYASQDAGLLTACLWATRHRSARPAQSTWNLGRALRSTPNEHAQRIWQDLCTANESSLPRRMASAVEVLATYGAHTDWHRLHRDLRSWQQGFHRAVLRRWCTGLFGGWQDRAAAEQPHVESPLDELPPYRQPDDDPAERVTPSRSNVPEESP